MKKLATQKTGTHKSTATCKDVCFSFFPLFIIEKKTHTGYDAGFWPYGCDTHLTERLFDVARLDARLHETHCNTFPPDKQAGLLL